MFFRVVAVLVAGLQLVSTTQVALQSTGRTLILGGIPYFVPPTPVSVLHDASALSKAGKHASNGLVPFSVIPTGRQILDSADLDGIVSAWSTKDDVWSKDFLHGVFVTYNGTRGSPSTALSSARRKYNIDFVILSKAYAGGVKLTEALPAGPYFLEPASGNIYEAWRLYNDENQSFLYGTIPDGDGGFQILSARIPGAATETIGVPSRLYFTPTAEKPLAGMRLGVKDIYDVKGLRTGCGNRAFWSLYPPRNQTAPAVQRLLDGGMILVGKTKTSQFANGETATADWVDLHAPYNSRGDGYQDGSSSSTGSGTAIAAYPWLDFTIGTDTGASMRAPAAANGVFGNRPSHGAVPLDNVMPLSPALDTGGIFARDAKLWATAGHWWYQSYSSFTQFPKKLLFPIDFFGTSFASNAPAAGSSGDMFNQFITKVEGFLNTTRTEISIASTWNSTKPDNVSTSSLQTLLATTYDDIITIDQVSLLADPFIADYGAANGGRMPFIDPSPLERWAYGRGRPAGTKEEALTNKTIFMDWWSSEVIRADPTTCSDAILVYPLTPGLTNYRNGHVDSKSVTLTRRAEEADVLSVRVAVFAEVPDMVIPIGEKAYKSAITGQTEFVPVAISFVAAKGCDLMLFNLFTALQDAGIIKPVSTGTRVFP